MSIRNVIFDLGGVLCDLHFDRTHTAFAALGADNFHEQWSLTKQSELFDAFETGRIDAAAFRAGLRTALTLKATDDAIDAAWNAMVGEIPSHKLAYVNNLRPKYRTFLLSNTNELHIARVFAHVREAHGHANLDPFFTRAHYSHQLGHRKPTPEAFQAVLAANGLTARESLFVDDLEANCAAARSVGLQARVCTPGAELATLLGF